MFYYFVIKKLITFEMAFNVFETSRCQTKQAFNHLITVLKNLVKMAVVPDVAVKTNQSL